MDVQLYIRDCRNSSALPLKHPLSKYEGVIHVCCEYPMKSIIKSTCADVSKVIQDVKSVDIQKMLTSIRNHLSTGVRDDNFDNDILLYEIGTQVAKTPIKLYLFNMPKDRRMCTFCGERGVMKKCNDCNHAFYCNRECQKRDWIQHKEICNVCKFNNIIVKI